MGFIDLLKKLGILRVGSTSATYKSATERPIELQENGVFDANKDLLSSNDNADKENK